MAIEIQKSHEGLLHKQMGVKAGEKISIGALMRRKAKDKKSGNSADEKRDVFALNARKWSHA